MNKEFNTETETPPKENWNQSLAVSWPAVLYLTMSPIAAALAVAWYIPHYGVHFGEIAIWLGMHYVTGLGITAGYHRHYSHRTHDAHPLLQLFYLISGAAVMQERVLYWARNHRVHHRYADTDLDPHLLPPLS